jgi:AraC-like DNA-binding protein
MTQALHEFRMAEVEFEIAHLSSGEVIDRRAQVAGHFYFVLDGELEGSARGRAPMRARVNDTLVVSGYVAHTVTARKHSRVLIGTEPHKHLDWLARSLDLVCVPNDPSNPLIRRLHGVMALIVDELDDETVATDQVTLERYADLTLFYFLRITNPDIASLDALPWNDAQLMRAINAMSEDPAANWTVDSLAEHAHMSPSAFALRFKSLIGETPKQTLTRIRLRAGARRLLLGDSLLDAAVSIGYSSEEAFSRAFQRQFGLPPGRWRRAQQV